MLFKKCAIGREDVSPAMRNYLIENGLLKKPRVELSMQKIIFFFKLIHACINLVSSHSATQALLSTELLQFYMDHGITINNMTKIIEYDVTDDLSAWVDAAAETRYLGTSSKEMKILGTLQKNCMKALV